MRSAAGRGYPPHALREDQHPSSDFFHAQLRLVKVRLLEGCNRFSMPPRCKLPPSESQSAPYRFPNSPSDKFCVPIGNSSSIATRGRFTLTLVFSGEWNVQALDL